uniref:Reverse transcriptase domain-containing protein n=1 Tax=Caenorhabditis japonica TaxID=281687 RepID=A0A8R1ETP5_CAEJA
MQLSVVTDDRLAELLGETKTIKYDIIELSEAKRAAEIHMMHRDGTGVFLGKRNVTSVSGGVGFIVNSTLLPKIKEIKFLDHRIAYLTFQVDRRLSCTVFQVYDPVADTDPEESNRGPPVIASPSGMEIPPPFLPEEVRAAFRSFPNGKAAGDDKITADFLKICHDNVIFLLTDRFTKYLQSGKVPEKWKTSNTTLIFKKGDKEDLENYRPICLLPVLYKEFTKCVLNRIRTTLEEAQPVEQAGFRRSFSAIDHIHSIQRLLEVGREYQQPLTLVFIDFPIFCFYPVFPVFQ